jgi:TolB-like protein/Tfp pilus assembly protein PilF
MTRPSESPDDARLMMLAEAAADGLGVDWEDAESSAADPDASGIIKYLRVLADVARLHQSDGEYSAAAESAGSVTRTVGEAPMSIAHSIVAPESWGPLRIVDEIGRGRFGTVYRAIDPRLDREVALKLLHVLEPGQRDQATAVIKEGRVLAQIRHANVVTVFGADYFDERVGLWMEFIKGQTLKQIQQEQGSCSAQEAALIGLSLCLALAAVHRAGVLHRDIKAQNVMREVGGRIVLMDFGASEWSGPDTPPAMPLKGTPLYLAPELLNGHEATAGSDIYALGVLLYHLVSGRFPYEAADLDALRRAHRRGRSTRLHDIRPDLPDGFVRTIECALDPDRKRRFGSAGSMQFALAEAFGLRFLAEASDASTRAAVAEAAAGADTTPSIAVLPFSDMSPEHDQEYFCEGIAEELINALSTLTGVRVTARSSSFQFSGHAQDIRKVGEQLNVRTVLEGSVRKAGTRIRITAQLIDVAGGYHLWSERYDRDLDDVFTVQDEIARAIVAKLKVKLAGESSRPLVRRHTDDLEAYNLYLQGRYYWSRRYAGFMQRAIDCFEQTIAHDDSYALAHAGLAESYSLLGVYDYLSPRHAIVKAKPAAERAVQLDDTLAEAHQAMALVRWYFDWDYADAIREYQRALSLNPSAGVARALFGILLADLGRFREGLAEVEQALAIEPASPLVAFYAAAATSISGPLEAALPACRRVLELDPSFVPGMWTYSAVLSHLGQHAEAIETVERAITLSRRQNFLLGHGACIYAGAGRRKEAEAIRQELHARETQAYVAPLCFAEIAIALGEIDQAFEWLERAYQHRSPFLVALAVSPFYDGLRGDERFSVMLKKMGLEGIVPAPR